MSAADQKKQECVIYIGTRKLTAMLGEYHDGESRILRISQKMHAEGWQQGLVSNLEYAAESLRSLVRELHSGIMPDTVDAYVVLGNPKLRCFHYESSEYYQGQNRTVGTHEIRSVVSQTRSVATLPLSEFILQAIPESFLVNDLPGVKNPLGLEAERLGVKLNLFTMNYQDFKNIAKVIEMADIDAKGFFPKMLTASEAVLTEQEMDEGVLLIDVADDATQISIWNHGSYGGSQNSPAGGRLLSQMVAEDLKVEIRDAEKVKERFGDLTLHIEHQEELIPLIERNGNQAKSIKRGVFHRNFQRHAREWAAQILQLSSLMMNSHQMTFPHMVFIGGGVTMNGFLEFLQREFALTSARIGQTRKVDAQNEVLVDPSLAPALGMFRWLATHDHEQKRLFATHGIFEKAFASARSWFYSYF